MARTVKTLAPGVVTAPGRAPFVDALRNVEANPSWTRFAQVEPLFRETMERFDRMVAAGETTQGDRQNGKGDFLNDLLALLLERCSGKDLHRRPKIPGLLFENHNLDVAYPRTGTVLATIETKATGIPKHPGSTQQRAVGRNGGADLDKRIKEAAFKDIDIKGQYARSIGLGGGATSDLVDWLRRTPPRNWLLLSVRVTGATDLDAVVNFAQVSARWFDNCGLYAYGHVAWDLTAPYEEKRVPPVVQMDRVLANVCTALRTMP